MPRATKLHIRHPSNGRETICGRMSVAFAKKDSDASCGVCQAMATSGQLERLRNDEAKDRWAGANQEGEPKCTPMQLAFARHPLVTTNPVKAAREVGYSESYARDHARKLRKQMSSVIMRFQEEAQKHSAISASRIQEELACLGFANIKDYYHIDEETGHMRPKMLGELTREQAAAIQEMEMMEIDTEDGPKVVVGKIKLADKRANLVELGKTIGMFNKFTIEDRRKQTLDLGEVPTEDLERVENYLLNKARQARAEKENRDAIPGEFTESEAPQLEGPAKEGE